MINEAKQAWTGKLPGRTPETAPFWEGCNEGVFLLQRCRRCDQVQYHYRAHCSHCWSDEIEDFPSAGKGTVWTCSTVYKNNSPGYRERTPYSVAVVELEGGVKVLGNVVDGDPEQVYIGMPVELRFSRAQTGQMIPVFVAVTE